MNELKQLCYVTNDENVTFGVASSKNINLTLMSTTGEAFQNFIWKHTYRLSIVPSLVVTILSKDLYWWLRAVHFQSGHVEIINKENKVFSQRGAKHTFTPKEKKGKTLKKQIKTNLYTVK